MARDPFDLETLRVDPAKHKPTKSEKWRRHYVQIPWDWIEQLKPTKRSCAYQLAYWLAYEHWRTGGRPIVLSNAALKEMGVARRSKWNALAELEKYGMVLVQRRPRKSPIVTVRFLLPRSP